MNMMLRWSDTQKIGLCLVAFGLLISVSGVVLFFDPTLLSIGNILIIIGTVSVIGFQYTMSILLKKHRWKSSICLVSGIIMVLMKCPLIGIPLEVVGSILMFGGTLFHMPLYARRLNILSEIFDKGYQSTMSSILPR